ncbi:MAG: glycoside hydrolase family 65 protein, partial [Candidatus Sericytochromatia bacterium]|nr:glycoside hydrolase family 65 protein [Candidatus Sericytochromatia bacterium]
TMVPEATGATFVSVGVEPEGLPGGVIYLPGGPTRFLALMTDQASRQSAGLPSIYLPTLDATWTVTALGFDPLVEHEVEARLAIANGYLGCRSALAESDNGARPASFVAGIFAAGVSGLPELVVCQDWRKLSLLVAGEPMSLMDGDVLLHQRTLDLRRGVLHRVWRHRSAAGRITRLHEVRWASLADRHCLIQRLFVRPENYVGSLVIVTGLDGQVRNLSGSDHLRSVAVGAQPATSLTMSALGGSPVIAFATARGPEVTIETGPEFVCERIPAEVALGCGYEHQRQVVVYASRDTPGPESAALASVTMPTAACALEAEQAHVGAWASLWREADIRIEGDPTAQQAIRFALYHLFAAANPEDERLSIGARALSGEGYLGHVFWDTEIYVVPVFQHTHPAMARALLMYRYHTLPAARERARSMGYRGALHAWESADTGADITPSQVIGPLGNVIPILTGLMEHHIAADVAFAVWQYWTATGEDAFMQQAGTEIMVEVARFWASRALPGDDGQSHIRHVIGPDEYHVDVDDNAYTNVMAQWVLRRAAEVVRTAAQAWPATWLAIAAQLGWQADEPDQWLAAANTLVTGLDPATGLLEQFAGYFQLTPIELPPLDQRIGPADMLLGPDVVAGSQVIKQADVVMLLHVLWDHFAADARAANFAFYEPRTAHDSTLSPGIYGALAARLGDVDKAKRYFDLTADIDLGSEAHSTADGVHVAALASLWHLIVFGFAGWRLSQNGLALDPRLPPAWAELEVPFRYRTWQTRLRLRAAELDVTIEGTGTFGVHLDGSPARTLAPGSYRAVKRDDRWQWLEAA